MAWDTEETKRRLLEAAVVEFAERGPDGTTMERVAARAKLNKERLYNYFGDKRSLFEAVLTSELGKLAAAVDVGGDDLSDIGEFAGRTFDYYVEHPYLARLLQWEGLAGGSAADETGRAEHYQYKVARVLTAQHEGTLASGLDPAHLMFLLIGLASAWFSVPQLARMMTGADNDTPGEIARRRAGVVTAARLLGGQ